MVHPELGFRIEGWNEQERFSVEVVDEKWYQ
jgi:hypothetical protein